jgi:DNA-binding response OmpR family regulator
MKIAIIEDNVRQAIALRKCLEEAHHEVKWVIPCITDGLAKATAEIRAFGPDLILIDHNLDVCDYYNGADVVRSLPEIDRRKFISISGETNITYCDDDRRFKSKGILDSGFPGPKEELLALVEGAA